MRALSGGLLSPRQGRGDPDNELSGLPNADARWLHMLVHRAQRLPWARWRRQNH
jgi:hypothetical protein